MIKNALDRDSKAARKWKKQLDKYSQNLKKKVTAERFAPLPIEQTEQTEQEQLEYPLMGGKVSTNLRDMHHYYAFAPQQTERDDAMSIPTPLGDLPRLIPSKARNPMDYHPQVHFADPFQEPKANYYDYVKRSTIDGLKKQEILDQIMEKAYEKKKKSDKGDKKKKEDESDNESEEERKRHSKRRRHVRGRGLESLSTTDEEEQVQDQVQDQDQDQDQDPDLTMTMEHPELPVVGQGAFYVDLDRRTLPIIRRRGGILCSSDHACTQPHRWSGEGSKIQMNLENPKSVMNWIVNSPSMDDLKESMIGSGAMELRGAGPTTSMGSIGAMSSIAPPVGAPIIPPKEMPMGPPSTQEVNGSLLPDFTNGGKATKMRLGAQYLSMPEGTWMPFKALRKIPRSSRAIYKDIPRVQLDIRGNPRFLKQENNWEGALRYFRMTPQKSPNYGRVRLIGGLLKETAPIFPGE